MANRTPSPNPTITLSPNPRTPENGACMRKMPWVNPNFSKQPISHNPADLPHSNSGSKGGIASASAQASVEQKENRVKSPSVTSSKGTKNFMAPTISASSKVTAASPKKKILMERNEIVRSSLTSVSSSVDFIASLEAESNSETGCGPRILPVTPNILKASMNETRSVGSRESLGSHEMGNGDFRLKNDRSVDIPSYSPSPVIAPLDADPRPPPYDPKTNYLSPRPQFLRYRPKPPVEIFLNQEGLFDLTDGKQSDDSFSSETGDTRSSGSEKDSEDDSPSSLETQKVEIETPDDDSPTNPTNFEEAPKSRPFLRFKTVLLVLLLAVACLFISVTDTPILSPPTMIQQPFTKINPLALRVLQGGNPKDSLATTAELIHLSLGELACKLRRCSTNFVVQYTSLVSIPREDIGLFLPTNLTCPALDQRIEPKSSEKMSDLDSSAKIQEEIGKEDEGDLEFGKEKLEVMFSDELNEKEGNVEQDIGTIEMGDPEDGEDEESTSAHGTVMFGMKDLEINDPKEQETITEEVMECKENAEDGKEEESTTAHAMVMFGTEDLETNGPKEQATIKSIAEELMESKENERSALECLPNVEDEVKNEPNLSDMVESEAEKFEVHDDVLSLAQVQSTGVGIHNHDFQLDEISGSSPYIYETPETNSNESVVKIPPYGVLGLLSAILGAIVVSLYLKRKSSPKPSAVDELKVPSKKEGISSEWGGNECLVHAQSPFYQNYTGEVETLGGSAPSFSSSLQNSSSCDRRKVKEDETLSQERVLRRDSVASSTSYGSFTTYEKLSGKKVSKGYGDEDMVITPVRRSNRIRNLATSP